MSRAKIEAAARRMGIADPPAATITTANEYRRKAAAALDQAQAIERRSNGNLTNTDRADIDRHLDTFDRNLSLAEAIEDEIRSEKAKLLAEREARDGGGGSGSMNLELRDGRVLRGYGPADRIAGDLGELRDRRLIAPPRQDESEHGEPEPGSFGRILRSLATGPRSDMDRRAMTLFDSTSGGALLGGALSAQILDDLRLASRVVQGGLQTIPIPEGGSLTIVKATTAPSAGWREPSKALPESAPKFAGITLKPRTLGATVTVPVELLQDASNVDSVLRRTFAESFASELDRVALLGQDSGDDSAEPRGILSHRDDLAGVIDMGATAGAAIEDYSPLLDLLEKIETANGPAPRAWIAHPRTWRQVNGFADTTDQPLRRPPALEGAQFLSTTAVPITDSHGTASDASKIYGGGFDGMAFCPRVELTVKPMEQIKATSLEVVYVAFLRADFALIYGNRLGFIEGVVPPSA